VDEFRLPTAIGARLGEMKRSSGTDAEGRSCMLRMRLTGGYSRSCDSVIAGENHQYRASNKNVALLALALSDGAEFPRMCSPLLSIPPTSEREERGGKRVIHSIIHVLSFNEASTSGMAGGIPC
jgi:hypothetical protein